MPIVAGIIGAIGLATSAIGLFQANNAQNRATRVQSQISAQSQQVEKQRELQMHLDAMRLRREAIRQMVVTRSQALSNATLAGAGDSSGLQGGLSQESAKGRQNVLGIYTNEDIGKEIFQRNEAISQLGTQLNQAQADVQAGQGLFNLGSSILGSATTVARIGTSLFSGSRGP